VFDHTHPLRMTANANSPVALVVGEDRYTRFVARSMLEPDDFQIVEADHADSALALFQQAQPDIVLLADMDAIATCARLRALPGGDRVPILMITDLDTERMMERAFEAGVNDLITKPLRRSALRHVVRRLLRTAQLEEALARGKKEWEATFDAVSDLIVLTDMQGRIVRCNLAAIARVGATFQNLIGQNIGPILFGYSGEGLSGLSPAPGEIELPRLGGWFDASHFLVRLASGEPGYVHIFRDVSEQRRAQLALRQSESRYRSLFEDSPMPLWEEDFSAVKRQMDELRRAGVADFRAYLTDHPAVVAAMMDSTVVLDVNRAALELYGASDKEHLLGGVSAVLGDETIPVFRDELIALAEGRLEFASEGVNYSLSGKRIDIFLRLSVVRGFEATWEKVLVAIEDITERKRLQAQMLAEQKLVDLGALAAGVAHEINSPLQVITGACDGILNRLDHFTSKPETLRKRIESIKRNGWRCAEIARALLTYARSPAGQTEPTPLNGLVHDTLLLIEHQLLSWSNIAVATDLSPDLPPLTCDRNQISQAIINLLTNARDAMPDGGEIVIRTGFAPESGRLRLQVSDNGVGIPPAARAKIFDPFFTTKVLGKGTGLGLSIVNGIVRGHGGAIEVESGEGSGTTFTILLPADGAAPAPLTALVSVSPPVGRFDDTALPVRTGYALPVKEGTL